MWSKIKNWFKKKPEINLPELIQAKPGHTGQKIFQVNLETFDITEAATAKFRGKKCTVKKEGFWYCSALNIKNAEKQFIKMAKNVK